MLWRHGDVLIAAVPSIPAEARQRPNLVLAHGELTGHSHRIAETETAELWECGGVLYLRVVADQTRVVHQEHAPITLPRGDYRVWQQREYTPSAIRRVFD
jgi:hypothetical protein